MSSTKIVIDGKEYSSLNELPEQFRRFLTDKNQNGMPDAMEGLMNLAFSALQKPGEPLVIDARGDDFLNRIPPEAREKVRQSIEQLRAWKQGMTNSPEAAPTLMSGSSFPSGVSAPMDYDKLYRDLTRPQGQSRSYLIWAVLFGFVVMATVLGLAAYFLVVH